MEPPGEFYARLAIARENVLGADAFRYDLYTKYGISDHWMAIAKIERVEFDRASQFDGDGYRLALRRGVIREGPVRLAIEGGLVGGRAIGGLNGCEGMGGELRASVGTGWRRKNTDYFAFMDVIGRWHRDDCRRERLEAGFGQTFDGKWQVMSQVWLERGTVNARSDKTEVSLTRKFDDFEVSLGYRYEFSGRFDERAVVFAISATF